MLLLPPPPPPFVLHLPPPQRLQLMLLLLPPLLLLGWRWRVYLRGVGLNRGRLKEAAFFTGEALRALCVRRGLGVFLGDL